MAKQNDSRTPEEATPENRPTAGVVSTPICGIIMPIAGSTEYPAEHWAQVKSIISEAVRDAGYEARLVSDGNNSSIIHSRIVTNIYQDEIVVCDVSNRNPNVMLELGLRLASQKPVIVIKDDVTPYSFDSSPIEHIPYPKGLDYYSINEFKRKLTARIHSDLDAVKKAGYKSFLDSFSIPHLSLGSLKTEELGLKDYLEAMESRIVENIESRLPSKQDKSSPTSHLKPYVNYTPRFTPEIEAVIHKYFLTSDNISMDEEYVSALLKTIQDSGVVSQYGQYWMQPDGHYQIRTSLKKSIRDHLAQMDHL
ncbi:hypothetical protein GCM10027346_20680 [Hymenobacter seoulensis]